MEFRRALITLVLLESTFNTARNARRHKLAALCQANVLARDLRFRDLTQNNRRNIPCERVAGFLPAVYYYFVQISPHTTHHMFKITSLRWFKFWIWLG